MQTLHQNFTVSYHYPVYFTEGLFHPDNTILADVLASARTPKALFVVDSGVVEHHPALLKQIKAYAKAHAQKFTLAGEPLVVTGGETVKNDPDFVDQLLKAVNVRGIDRHSYLIAIGGGAVLDMAGFAATISHRGVRHVRIPTTVLSQNDSGIGVKNSVNAFGKKNFLGTFAPPQAIINDFAFLSTLDDRDWRGGISEAIKVALIKDKVFFDTIQRDAARLAAREAAPMHQLIHRCAAMHLEHIAGGDPFEMGSSRPLDFGHWSAHKLETLSGFSVRHGEAVAIGIALDTVYSHLKGMLTTAERDQVLQLLRTLGFTLYVPELGGDGDEWPLLAGLQEFREHLGGELTIMLLEQLGKGVEVHEIDETLMKEAILFLEAYQRIPVSIQS
ncbi:3-dehydroquinate synthase [Catalinimonas alkaloidigena]|uniref:3-dehydroquinate synthase n=1 Tax=Catalinimonas alkaloidigena TaxID=1075417 RepID=A0A1G9GG80_9BACT|nr:3-dehydroquinate synthase [Catalinimonas alkaloidigena]SDK99699.1 3-dehydroquinate synthase [Catalinimonas alkaloidigena]